MKRIAIALSVALILGVLAAGIYAGARHYKGVMHGQKAASCPMMQSKKAASLCPMMKGQTQDKNCPIMGQKGMSDGGCPMKDDQSTTAKQDSKTISAICPVMKNNIPDVTKAAGKSVYKGKTYYFCCGGCKPEFDKDPAKYVK